MLVEEKGQASSQHPVVTPVFKRLRPIAPLWVVLVESCFTRRLKVRVDGAQGMDGRRRADAFHPNGGLPIPWVRRYQHDTYISAP